MKKRTVGILAGLVTLGLVVYVASRLGAQPVSLPAAPGAAAPRTKICLVNLGQVIQRYQKFLNYQNMTKADREQAQRTIESRKKQLTDWAAEHDNPQTPAARKEQLAHSIKTAERELKDYTDDYNEKHARAEVDLMIAIYKDVQDVVKRYAVARDVDLVLQYNDFPNPAEFYNPQVFVNKMRNQALMPMVMAGGMDITDQVIGLLNQPYTQGQPNGMH